MHTCPHVYDWIPQKELLSFFVQANSVLQLTDSPDEASGVWTRRDGKGRMVEMQLGELHPLEYLLICEYNLHYESCW